MLSEQRWRLLPHYLSAERHSQLLPGSIPPQSKKYLISASRIFRGQYIDGESRVQEDQQPRAFDRIANTESLRLCCQYGGSGRQE